MIVKGILMESYQDYKKPSMFVLFPYCTWKCEKDSGIKCCQNSSLAKEINFEVDTKKVVDQYLANPLTNAVVMGGLEPIDSFNDVWEFISVLRQSNNEDDVVIYTGYNKEEIEDKISILKRYKNIYVKYGRFVPDSVSYYNEVLGVFLKSSNQYCEKIS